MIRVACALIQDSVGRLLLAKRPEGKYLAGFWEFPGGKLEIGETAEEALSRELREELLIDVEILQRLQPVEHEFENFSICLIPCRARVVSGVPTALEHSEIGWFHIDQINLDELAPADIPILTQFSSQ